ncbi:hypothetical protein PMIT1323_02524 [Prochlorococcus marinus str. MIT 1323]|nr:hypothetical protein PMIT1323_02524 [Prochlorococcus marinus str. MIT 1323]
MFICDLLLHELQLICVEGVSDDTGNMLFTS